MINIPMIWINEKFSLASLKIKIARLHVFFKISKPPL